MWTEWRVGDHETASRILAVMNPVDRAYQNLGENWLTLLVAEKQAHILYYQAGEVRVVIIVHYTPKMRMYRVATAGFSGPVAPAVACAIGMDRLHQFLRERGETVAYTIRRRGLELTLANEFLDAVLLHPGFQVTVEHDMVDRVAWKLRLVELPDEEAIASRVPMADTTFGHVHAATSPSPPLATSPFVPMLTPDTAN